MLVKCQDFKTIFRSNGPFEESLFQALPVTRESCINNLVVCHNNLVVALSIYLFYVDQTSSVLFFVLFFNMAIVGTAK